MATLFRKKRSPYWWTAFFDGGGKRRYCSTKQRRRTDAVRIAAELEYRARATVAGDTAVSRRIFAILEEAGDRAVRASLSEANGRELLNRILEAASGSPVRRPSIQEWLEEWLRSKRDSRSEGTYLRYEGVVRSFLDHLGEERRGAALDAVTGAEIRAFRDYLLQGGRTVTTVNMAVKILRTPFNLAKRQGILMHNPAEAIEPISSTRIEKGVFTSHQVATLVAAAQGDWQGLILAGYYTGARIGDLSNLRWKAVNLNQRTVTFVQGKTNRPVQIPLHPELEGWLQKRMSLSPENGFVFPSLAGRTSGGNNGLSGQFRRIMTKAGIEGEVSPKLGEMGRNRSSLSFHSLRHSFNSEMANAGVPQELRQRLTGHASKAVNDHYTHAVMETLRRAVATVPAISVSETTEEPGD